MAKKKTDKLAQDVSKAIAAKMSYGKWMAMQQPVKAEKEIPEGWVKCEYCGKPFRKHYGKRFCDLTCRQQAYLPRYNEIKQENARKYRERNGWKK